MPPAKKQKGDWPKHEKVKYVLLLNLMNIHEALVMSMHPAQHLEIQR